MGKRSHMGMVSHFLLFRYDTAEERDFMERMLLDTTKPGIGRVDVKEFYKDLVDEEVDSICMNLDNTATMQWIQNFQGISSWKKLHYRDVYEKLGQLLSVLNDVEDTSNYFAHMHVEHNLGVEYRRLEEAIKMLNLAEKHWDPLYSIAAARYTGEYTKTRFWSKEYWLNLRSALKGHSYKILSR